MTMSKATNFLLLSLTALLLISCGKVVQETKEDDDVPIFTAKFELPVFISAPTSNTDAFTVDDDVYTVISGINTKKRSQLSWGKSIIEKIPVTPTEEDPDPKEKFIYKSKTFNKSGIEISGSDHTWIYGDYKQLAREWQFDSKELKRKFPRYLITAFSDQNHFAMKMVYDEVVSGNATFRAGTVSDYDTFLTILQLVQMETDARDVMNPLMPTLFNEEFFTALNYTPPKNQAMEFSLKRPVFIFDRKLEIHLLTILDLASVEPDEAILFLDQLKEPLLTTKAREHLEASLQGLTSS